jgi:hypothetical protein
LPIRTQTTGGPVSSSLRTTKSSSVVMMTAPTLAAEARISRRGPLRTAVGDLLSGVAERLDLSCKGRRQLGVDQEAQSCAPQDGWPFCRAANARTVVREDLFPGGAGRQEIQDVVDATGRRR